ncbi:MAG TPA: hypothetical protein EYP57_00145 [Thermodesulfobacteriaceae bacterium]|nr:hypothetical protein [Thermodesulfobacteriaceae bacterium]
MCSLLFKKIKIVFLTNISVFFLYAISGYCLDLSNDPMETKVQSAPANIMFVLDNSGSMDWEFVTTENNGKFRADGTDYEYLFDDPGDNNYKSGSNSNILSGDKRGYWKSQWSGYNKIYYNPQTDYEPWPRMSNVEISTLDKVRSNPLNSSPVFNLTADFLSIRLGETIDNVDQGFSKSDTGWATSSSSNQYGDDYYYSYGNNDPDNLAWARWTTTIHKSGNYAVRVWWTANSNRSTSVSYRIYRDDNYFATIAGFDQTSNGGQWHKIIETWFNAGEEVTVLLQTEETGTSKYCADAVKFDFTDDPILIKNAHYYTWDDTDNSGTLQNGEVYLVNFTWTDSDGDGIVDVDDNDTLSEVKRSYFKIDDNGNDKVENGELIGPLGDAEIPDAVRARRLDENGGLHFMTVKQEIQNFANRYSFYRRREHTAKYAVASTIDDFNYVNAGIYTINDGVRQQVLPIHVNRTVNLIVDNKDSGFSKPSGTWNESSAENEYDGSSLYTNSSGGTARWTPNIPNEGDYDVYAWWDYWPTRDTNACYRIHHAGGTTNCIRVNQQENASSFNLLGRYHFNQGTDGYVEVVRDGGSTGSSTSADAVLFESVSVYNTDETDTLLDLLYGIDSYGGTPLRNALYNVGRYFDVEDNGGFSGTPYLDADKGGACQQAFAIVMTDGYYNGSFSAAGNQDAGMETPYGDVYSNTLADVAMKFYDDDLADNLEQYVPTNNFDNNKRQHLVTYGIAFGVEGTIPLMDMDQDGTPDGENCNYKSDPYFLNDCTPHPSWPDPDSGDLEKIDDLWHAAVNGHGEYFSAESPDELVESLRKLSSNLKSRLASGASVSVNGEELNSGTVLYQATYEAGKWIGDVTAYPINHHTGEILREEGQELWKASDKLQDTAWNNRNIITSDGYGAGSMFRFSSLSNLQKGILNNTDVVDYICGKEVTGFRPRERKLGDIVHSAPLLAGSTIYAGGNDGMLHAFNAQTGEERFAYIPNLVYGHLKDLTQRNYNHRFYVDITPYSRKITFYAGNRRNDRIDNDGDGLIDEPDEDYSDGTDNDGDGITDEATEKEGQVLLVGGLARGGKGYFCLDITQADLVDETTSESDLKAMVKWEYPPYQYSGNYTTDGIDNDGDGIIDEIDENYSDGIDNDGDNETDEAGEIMTAYVFAGDQSKDGIDNDGDGIIDEIDENYSNGIDDDWDGIIDEEGEMKVTFNDNDIGYSFSRAYIVKSYRTMNSASTTNHPWITVFGNGYESVNGHAVLYILDARTGALIRKIDTGAGGNNGLSSPCLVDTDNDGRVDYAYAGDLKGNMWKFDLTDPTSPANWGVAYGVNVSDPTGMNRIDAVDGDTPKPLFTAPGQPITSRPDVMHHCSEHGYMVLFGTGKFLGESDREDLSVQTIFGIWDYGDDEDDNETLGEWDRSSNTISGLPGVKLLQQTVIDERYINGAYLRTLSANATQWYLDGAEWEAGSTGPCNDGVDNDGDSLVDSDDPGEVCQKPNPLSFPSYCSDGLDNDDDGDIDETGECTGHVGWYFDLPFEGERLIKDVVIRDGVLIALSFTPNSSPCSGGGNSVIHEMNACSGGRLSEPQFDINGDRRINYYDLINIGTADDPVLVPPTGLGREGLLHPPVFLTMPDKRREIKIFSSSAGTTEAVFEKAEEVGILHWREVR